MKGTIRLDGKRHRIPSSLYDFYCFLELLPGVKINGGGRFICRNYANRFETKIQYYNDTTKTLRIKAQKGGFIMYCNLVIEPSKREEIEKAIKNYSSKKNINLENKNFINDCYNNLEKNIIGNEYQ
ncbi:MAG: hypothetical protein QXW97_00335 [Candidatus Pacearchaeota archaeon]